MTAEASPFIDATQAGEMLGVHENSVYVLIDEGLLPAGKVGKSWRLLRQDVINYIAAQIEEQTRLRREKKTCNASATLPSGMQRRRPRRADSFSAFRGEARPTTEGETK